MITVAVAQAGVIALARPLPSETVPLAQAHGRWMTHPATALRDQPPFDASAMDGYAVSGDPGPGATFSVVGEAAAGRAWTGTLSAGQALRIFTGAPVPDGADRVIIQEDVTRDGNLITVGDRPDAARHIRARGQDFAAGATLSPRRLRPGDLALLAAMNVATVTVARRPVVALVATGDELVVPGENPRDDQIIASNAYALMPLAQGAGAIVRHLPLARDTPQDLAAVLAMATGADLVVTIGGASVGDHDLVAQAIASAGGELDFHKVSLRPGKPLMAGRLGQALLLGLPGNPVSAVVCAHLFMLPMIRALQGDPAPLPVPLRARLAAPVGPTGPRTHYMRARLSPGPDLPLIEPFGRQDSALLGVLADSDALLIRPLGDGPQPAGSVVEFLPL
jgi:molybdopterin molybdotransferase